MKRGEGGEGRGTETRGGDEGGVVSVRDRGRGVGEGRERKIDPSPGGTSYNLKFVNKENSRGGGVGGWV